MQEAAADLAKEVPYEKASKLFAKLSGISMSDHLMHEVTNTAGEGLSVLDVSPTPEEIAARIQEVSVGKKWRPIMVLGIDGADDQRVPKEVALDVRSSAPNVGNGKENGVKQRDSVCIL